MAASILGTQKGTIVLTATHIDPAQNGVRNLKLRQVRRSFAPWSMAPRSSCTTRDPKPKVPRDPNTPLIKERALKNTGTPNVI